MNTPKVAAALNTISLAFGELAEALTEANGQNPVTAPPTASRAVSGAPGTITASTADAGDLFPPFAPEEPVYEAIPLPADSPGLGRCPNHNLPWTVKAAGVSKAGKSYTAFYRCDGKDQDGTFCQKRPAKAWADAHPL